jgi:hypothetical protein
VREREGGREEEGIKEGEGRGGRRRSNSAQE